MPEVILNHVPAMATATPVPVLEAAALSQGSFLNDYVAHSRPCVIRGAVSHWQATKTWGDPEYLKTRCEHDVIYWPQENHVSVKRIEAGKKIVPFAEAVDLIQTTPVAAFFNAMPSKLDSDMGDFSFFPGGEPGLLYPPHRIFFFRSAGSVWHYHPFDETLMCQIKEPKNIGLLHVNNPFHRHIRHIFFKEDYYDHPYAFEGLKDADLKWFSAHLEAGDSLYIPPLWWHGVTAPSGEIGVTIPVVWRSPPHVIIDTIRKMAAGEIDLLGTIEPSQFQRLSDFARQAGVERELKAAFDRAVREGRVGIAAQ